VTCDFDCQEITCEEPVGLCGNGVLDAGEACEPPGTATCDHACQSAPCEPPPSGEATIACVDQVVAVAAGSNGQSYLAAWSAPLLQPGSDILVRRLGSDGAPLDAGPTVLSAGLQCHGIDQSPAVASDGTDYAVSWNTLGETPFPTFLVESIYARGVGGGGGPTGGAIELLSNVPIGQCHASIGGPTAIAAGTAGKYSVLHHDLLGCAGGPVYQQDRGILVPLPAGSPLVAFDLDALAPPPSAFTESAGAIDSLGADTLAAWTSTLVFNDTPPFVTASAIRGGWVDSSGSRTLLTVGLARWTPGLGPDVTAGDGSFLVTFAARADDAATTATEIRGFRVTRAAGALDPDLGSLLASSSTQIVQGPVAAFDGQVWLLVWVEVSGGGHDLRAVAVRPDGSVVDATPRLLAAGVSNAKPAVASVGDGSVVVLFERSSGSAVAINALRTNGS